MEMCRNRSQYSTCLRAHTSVRGSLVERHFVVPETQTSETATTEWNVGRCGEEGEASRCSILLLTPLKRKFIPPATSRIYLIMHYHHHHHRLTILPHTTPYFCFTLPVLCIPPSLLHISILSPPLAVAHPLRIAHHFTEYTHVLFHRAHGEA